MKIEDLVRPNIRALVPYSSARDEFDSGGLVRLDANENPVESSLNRYPDPYQQEAKDVLARLKGLKTENLVLGNGSDELIDLLIRIFCEPGKDNVLGVRPSYGMYRVCCDLNNVEYNEIDLNEDFSLNVSKVLSAVTDRTKMIFLCSPNNPTGNLLKPEAIETILDTYEGIVVVDEAYVDFSSKNSFTYSLSKYPQIVVLQTLSKSFGMAGARIGMSWSSLEIVELLNRVKPPYNVNTLSQKALLDLESRLPEIKAGIVEIVRDREGLRAQLNQLDIVTTVFGSEANFLLVRFKNSELVFKQLIESGIIVRDRSREFGCSNCLRISVGTSPENNLLVETLKRISSEKSIVY